MFGLSFGELAIIAILALLLLGPDKLPDAAKTFAKGLKDLKRATEDLKEQLGDELNLDEVKRTVAEGTALPPTPPPVPPAQRGPPPAASSENVPGLEAARVEPAPPEGGEGTPR